jgi:hypothetical protein
LWCPGVNFSLQRKQVPERRHSAIFVGVSCSEDNGLGAVTNDDTAELTANDTGADPAGLVTEQVSVRGRVGVGTRMDLLRCSYARAKTTASAKVASYINAASLRSGFSRPVMNNCTCCGSVRVVSLQERHEFVAILVHRSRAPELGEFTNGVVRQRRPEAGVHQLHEACPIRLAAIELQTMGP